MKRLAIALALLLTIGADRALASSCATTAVGPITCKQSKICANASGTNTCAFGSSLTAGSVIVGAVGWLSTTTTLTSISGCGATWTLYDNPTTGSGSRSAAFSAVGGSGACTMTVAFSANASLVIVAHELTGADTTTPVGTRHASASISNNTAANGVTAGPVTAIGTDYIFGVTFDFNNQAATGPNPGTGYTQREGLGNVNGGGSSEDKSASGANTVTFTDQNTFENNTQHILSIAAAGGGGGGCTAPPNQLAMMGVGNCKGY